MRGFVIDVKTLSGNRVHGVFHVKHPDSKGAALTGVDANQPRDCIMGQREKHERS